MRMKAPAQTTPGPSFPRDGLLTAYTMSHAVYRVIVKESAHVDINRVVFPNRFIGAVKMRLSTVLLIILSAAGLFSSQCRSMQRVPRSH